MKEQLQREIDRNRQQGHASDRDLNVQQKTKRDNLMRDTFQPKPAQPETNAGKPKWGSSGELSYGRARPRDGPTDFSANVGVTYGVGKVQDPLDEQLHELLPLLTKTFGAEGRETPRCRSELIATYSGQGSPAQAEGEHRSLILTETRVLGAEAPETLKSRRCLAYALSRQKKLADGMRSQKKRAEAEQQRAVKAATPAQSFSPRS